MFGNAHLFDADVDRPMASVRGAGRKLCASCAPSFDPHRKARERRAEKALTESVRNHSEFFPSGDYWKRAPGV